MSRVIDLARARRARTSHAVREAGALREDMQGLCDEMERAVSRLREARNQVADARCRIRAAHDELARARRLLMRPTR